MSKLPFFSGLNNTFLPGRITLGSSFLPNICFFSTSTQSTESVLGALRDVSVGSFFSFTCLLRRIKSHLILHLLGSVFSCVAIVSNGMRSPGGYESANSVSFRNCELRIYKQCQCGAVRM